jgi:hypothetical protein
MEQTVTSYIAGFGIILIIMIMVVLIFVIWSVVWAYFDARRRGKSGLLVALVVLLMVWPVGLVLWLLLRPQSQSHESQPGS